MAKSLRPYLFTKIDITNHLAYCFNSKDTTTLILTMMTSFSDNNNLFATQAPETVSQLLMRLSKKTKRPIEKAIKSLVDKGIIIRHTAYKFEVNANFANKKSFEKKSELIFNDQETLDFLESCSKYIPNRYSQRRTTENEMMSAKIDSLETTIDSLEKKIDDFSKQMEKMYALLTPEQKKQAPKLTLVKN